MHKPLYTQNKEEITEGDKKNANKDKQDPRPGNLSVQAMM